MFCDVNLCLAPFILSLLFLTTRDLYRIIVINDYLWTSVLTLLGKESKHWRENTDAIKDRK